MDKEKVTIINKIRKNKPSQKPLPKDFAGSPASAAAELRTMFMSGLKLAGAEVITAGNIEEALSRIEIRFKDVLDFDQIEVWERYHAHSTKHDLEKIGKPLLYGQFGVAENGAIWLNDSSFPHRLIPFIAEELIILLNGRHIVRDMHEAYEKIRLDDTGFGIFISGPSKTADIEQSLVYGAHGPRKLSVVIY